MSLLYAQDHVTRAKRIKFSAACFINWVWKGTASTRGANSLKKIRASVCAGRLTLGGKDGTKSSDSNLSRSGI
jgi:hypothetical protein